MRRVVFAAGWCLLTAVAMPIARAGQSGPSESERIYKQAVQSTTLILVPSEDRRFQKQGSGCLIDVERRLVLTACHVAGEGESATVFFPAYAKGEPIAERDYYRKGPGRGRAIPGTVIAADPLRDLSVIQLKSVPKGIPALKLATKLPPVGHDVHSIGNPGAAGGLWLYTPGKIRQAFETKWESGERGSREMHLYHAHVIMTDSPVNQGDSGGPLLNDNGEVIGVAHGYSVDAFRLASFIDVREVRDLLKSHGLLGPRSIVTAAPRPAPEAVPAAGSKPADAPVDAEKQALIKYHMAKDLADSGLSEKARARCEKILEEYPNTKAAAQAKKLLDKLNDPRK